MNNTGSLNKTTSNFRQDHEPPDVFARLGWRYHHLGIPTNIPRPDEVYLEKLGMYVSGFKTCPFGIEWMRFEDDSPISELVRTVPHIAFEVDDIETALESVNSEAEITTPSKGVRVAMITHNGAPIELIEFSQNK